MDCPVLVLNVVTALLSMCPGRVCAEKLVEL